MTSKSSNSPTWQPLSKRKLATWSKLATRKGRQEAGQIVVEGVRLVGEALAHELPVEALIAIDPDGVAAAKRVVTVSGRRDIPLYTTDAASFARLSDTVHSAGVVAIVNWTALAADTLAVAPCRRALFCDAISDPGNLGTLIRTAAGLGLDIVVVGERSVEVTNPKVVRSTAGAIFKIPIYADVSVTEFLEIAQPWKRQIVLADPRGSGDIEAKLSSGWIAVVGGETEGLDTAWPGKGVARVKIPMHHGVESLNASVAGALLMDRLLHKEGTS